MKIIIISPSLLADQNISGISSITQFIIKNNTENEYLHFELGKRDIEKRNILWFLRILKAYLKWGYLLVHSRDYLIHFNLALSELSLIRDTPLIFLARLFRRRMVIHLHGGELLMKTPTPRWINSVLKYIFLNKNPIIVLSPLEKEVLQKKFNCKKIFILPNCIDLKEAKEFNRSYTKGQRLIILFIGRISLDKGIEFIFEAFEVLRNQGNRFKYVMAGKGPDEKLYVQKFRELLGADFEFKGVVSGDQKTELLKSCNVYLLPSFFEGLPMALLETMSFGIVPVTTNVGSIKYVINNGVNGIFVKKQSSEEIVLALKKLSVDNDYMQMLSKNARQFTFENYDPDKYIAGLNEIYNYV